MTSEARLPLPCLPPPRAAATAHIVVTTVDAQGRLSDRGPVRSLAWEPGRRLAVTADNDGLVARSQPNGTAAITGRGQLRLPSPLRLACRLGPGSRLLVAAYPSRDELRIYTITEIEAILAKSQGCIATQGAG